MQSAGNVGAFSPRSLVRDGADLCEELVRRGGRALTIPVGNRRMVVSFQLMPGRQRRPKLGISPELDDHDLARLASRSGASFDPAWSRGLALQYGGIQHR